MSLWKLSVGCRMCLLSRVLLVLDVVSLKLCCSCLLILGVVVRVFWLVWVSGMMGLEKLLMRMLLLEECMFVKRLIMCVLGFGV